MTPLRKSSTALAAALLLVAATPSAHSELKEVDLFAPGDALLTRDTSTGLDWLDLTQTKALSYASVAGGTGGWIGLGFGFADTSQVQTLFLDAGIVNLTGTYVPENYGGVSLLLSLMGQTWSGPFGEPTAGGFADLVPFSPSLVGAGGFTVGPFTPTASASVTNVGMWPKTDVSISTGLFLIRSVPEPETYALMLAGLGVMGLVARRRRKS